MAQVPVVPTVALRNGLEICRIINGMWQLSGSHGQINSDLAIHDMASYVRSGLCTFDMADIYGPAEEIFGNFIMQQNSKPNELQALTKLVQVPRSISYDTINSQVSKSIKKMAVQKLDCLQFHWWDYSDKRYLEVLTYLEQMRVEGKITELSLTNFDTQRLETICNHNICISSNQVQYSIIDQRPKTQMVPFCQTHNIKLLAYGVVCGGLLTDKYYQKPEPKSHQLNTASLVKYKRMIDHWGGWGLFQELLSVLKKIATKYNVSIADVAMRYVLDDPTVGGVIIGVRFGVSGANHTQDNFRSVCSSWGLNKEDLDAIHAVTRKSRDLYKWIGDCGSEYR